MEGQLAGRISREARGNTLPREVRRAAERVPDRDVALAIHRRAGHPTGRCVWGVGALLRQPRVALRIETKLVPPHAAASRGRVHRVHGHDRLAAAHVAIHEARHELFALRIEPAIGARLRHAARELPAAEIAVRRDFDLARARQRRSGRLLPVHVHLPRVDPSSSMSWWSCVPPVAIMMFGAPRGGSAVPSRSALFRKFTPFTMRHCSVAGRPFSIFARSTMHTCFWITSSPVLVGR